MSDFEPMDENEDETDNHNIKQEDTEMNDNHDGQSDEDDESLSSEFDESDLITKP